jgi:RNA polymerase sigma factor (sigma-70 family)
MDSETAASLESLHPDAFGWSLRCCGGDAGRAEEVLQNAYLKMAAGRVRFDGRSTFKTWWFGVIRLTALEEHRRARFRESLLGKLLASFTEEHHPCPSRQIERDEQAAWLQAALEKLPSRQAQTLHLVFYQDLTLKEAAQVMRVGLGSVRQHYERGKARLRVLLQATPGHER